jgi:hypothetical protein
MKYESFRRRYRKWGVIQSEHVIRDCGEDSQVVRNQLSRWAEKGLLIPLRKGFYVFRPDEETPELDYGYLAGRLYEPSYLSLEYALSYYGLIPERVGQVTSVTTKKTLAFQSPLGKFVYRHIKQKAFRGFKVMKSGRRNIFMAEPEKAVMDFLYFNLGQWKKDFSEELVDSYRLQNLDSLSPLKIKKWASCYEKKKLTRLSKILCTLIKKGS